MRAWTVVEFGAPLQETERATPEPTGTEVLLEVTHCGVCHSDLHIWDGYYEMGGGKRLNLAERGMTLPIVMGHEIVGRVTALGPDATGARVGDLRIVYPWIGCGDCPACRAEEDNMCAAGRALGVVGSGGYGSHVLVPSPRFLVDPGTVDPAVAATYACSGITVYGAITKVMPLGPDEPIVIVGAGGLGMNAIAVLRAMGHRNIVVVDLSEAKRAAALAAGAKAVVDAGAERVPKQIIIAGGGQAAAVIDLVNATATARFAFDALRKGGKLIQVGLFGGELTLSLPLMPIKALTLQGSYVGTVADLRALVALAQAGDLPALPVATLPQSRVNEALGRLREGRVNGRLVLRTEAA